MTSPKIAFVYLLNRMENAASAKEPSKAGFGEHRQAVVDHVNRIETELAAAHKKYNDALIHATNAEQYQAKQLADARAALQLIHDDCKRCAGLEMQTVIRERLQRIFAAASIVLAKQG